MSQYVLHVRYAAPLSLHSMGWHLPGLGMSPRLPCYNCTNHSCRYCRIQRRTRLSSRLPLGRSVQMWSALPAHFPWLPGYGHSSNRFLGNLEVHSSRCIIQVSVRSINNDVILDGFQDTTFHIIPARDGFIPLKMRG